MKKINFATPSLAINQKDKQLLFLLLSVVIAFLIYYFIISPGLVTNDERNIQVNILESEIVSVNESIKNVATLKIEDTKQRLALSEKYKIFFGDLREDKLINQFDILFRAATFNVSIINIVDKVVTTIDLEKGAFTPNQYPLSDMANSVNPPLNNNTEVVTEDTSNQTDQAAVPEDTVEMLQLNINFTNTGYANLMNFIKALEDMNKSIIISDANISKVETGTGINGMMTLNIYCIPKLINSENDYLQFNQQYINGTDSLF